MYFFWLQKIVRILMFYKTKGCILCSGIGIFSFVDTDKYFSKNCFWKARGLLKRRYWTNIKTLIATLLALSRVIFNWGQGIGSNVKQKINALKLEGHRFCIKLWFYRKIVKGDQSRFSFPGLVLCLNNGNIITLNSSWWHFSVNA